MNFNIDSWVKKAEHYGLEYKNVKFVIENNFAKVVAIDLSKDFLIKVNEPLLIPYNRLIIEEDFHKVKDVNNEFDNLISEYLDFIFSEEKIKYIANLNESLLKLNENLKHKLSSFGLNVLLLEKLSKKEIKKMLIHARLIRINNQFYFMPFMDMVNHSFEFGYNYSISKNSVSLTGKPRSKEIFAIYNTGDSFHFLTKYMFPEQSWFAYSNAVSFNINNKQINIQRKFQQFEIKNGIRTPKIEINENEITFSFVLIGAKKAPRQPFWGFKKACLQAGIIDSITLFSVIKNENIRLLVEILKEIDVIENPGVRDIIKTCALNQLEILGYSICDNQVI